MGGTGRRHHHVERLQRHVAIDRQRLLQAERADAADLVAGDVGDFLEPGALDALFTRRDTIVKAFEELAAQRGAAVVFVR